MNSTTEELQEWELGGCYWTEVKNIPLGLPWWLSG